MCRYYFYKNINWILRGGGEEGEKRRGQGERGETDRHTYMHTHAEAFNEKKNG